MVRVGALPAVGLAARVGLGAADGFVTAGFDRIEGRFVTAVFDVTEDFDVTEGFVEVVARADDGAELCRRALRAPVVAEARGDERWPTADSDGVALPAIRTWPAACRALLPAVRPLVSVVPPALERAGLEPACSRA
jgi:hypothetical protein